LSTLRQKVRVTSSSPTGLAALALFAALLTLAIVGPPIWSGIGGRIDTLHAYAGPSIHAWLGRDQLGRDVFARTMSATRLSLELSGAATLIAVLIGIPAGAAGGILGRRFRNAMARLIRLALAMPGILVALFLVSIIGRGSFGATVAIGVALAPLFARTAQTLTASIADSDFLAAARVIGVSRRRLFFRYLIPNTAEPLLLLIGVGSSLALAAISALSFLGLGVQSPQYDWGRILNDGLVAVYTTPSAAIAPGVAITVAGLTFSLFAETFARALNPRSRAGPGGAARRQALAAGSANGSSDQKPARHLPDQCVVAVENLHVAFRRGRDQLEAVAGVNIELAAGEIVGLVGESGSGKSLTALAIAGLAPQGSEVSADRLEFKGQDLRGLSGRARRRLLATNLAFVFQDPMSSLNPSMRVGRQLTEKVEVHLGMRRRAALELAESRLSQTHVPAARRRLSQYPSEYSGGMRQRAMIAMGLMTDPALIIADEPTTALDVTVQAQVLRLLREINQRSGTTVLLISHDLAVISEVCSRVIVMYAGRIVEVLPVDQLDRAAHPYSQALLGTVIDLDTQRAKPLVTIPGKPPGLATVRRGCPFASRCSEAMAQCAEEDPDLVPVPWAEVEHRVACWARVSGGNLAGAAAE
jgi:peptide/nickel transport system permease protein